MLLLRSLPLILPYDVMDYLIGSCNLHIEEELINQFWSHLDSVEDSWALSTREFRKAVGDKVIPLGFYGDEACMGLVTDPYNQIYGLFMSVVLFRPTSTRMSRYLLFSVDSHRIHSVEETFFPVLEQITASFNRLSNEGVHGRHFLVSEIRGDQSFFKYLFKHESWWRSTNVCFRCKATTRPTNLNYCVYESNDGWNCTCRSTFEFIRDELPHDKLCSLGFALFENYICICGTLLLEESMLISYGFTSHMVPLHLPRQSTSFPSRLPSSKLHHLRRI